MVAVGWVFYFTNFKFSQLFLFYINRFEGAGTNRFLPMHEKQGRLPHCPLNIRFYLPVKNLFVVLV